MATVAALFSVPGAVKRFARPFADRGLQCWLVGGAVRDLLMRRPTGDFDIATDAHPEQVRRMFRHVIPTGLRHGTVTVLFEGRPLEVTTFRTESGYHDGRRPDSVAFAPTIEQDLSRRDFTINGIAVEVPGGRIVDPFHGRDDLGRGLIRAIGDPAERFGEDACARCAPAVSPPNWDFASIRLLATRLPAAWTRCAGSPPNASAPRSNASCWRRARRSACG